MDNQNKKSGFKPLKRVLVYLLIILVVIVLILVVLRTLFAAELSPTVKADLKAAAALSATPSEAYTYLLGMDAPAGVDPMVRGRELLPRYVASSKTTALDVRDHKEPTEPEQSQIDCIGSESLKCSVSLSADCYQKFFTDKAARKQALVKNPETIQRYQQFKTFNDFHQPFPHTVFQFFTPIQHLLAGQRLMYLSWIDQAEGLYPEHQQLVAKQMQLAVLDDLNHWRAALGSADDLLLKTMIVRLIDNDLVMLGAIHTHYGVAAPQLALLNPQERSMAGVLQGEASYLNYLLAIDGNHFHCNWDLIDNCVVLSLNFIFNDVPDLMNIASERLRAQLQLASLEPAVAYRHKDEPQAKVGLGHWLRNPLELIHNQGADIDYKAYAFRVLDINLGITLLNASAAQPIGNVDPAWLASIQSPYGASAGHASINKDGWLCLPSAIKPDTAHKFTLDGCIPWSKDVVLPPPATS